ncbi:MAG: hypothetical protein SOH56_05780 [Lentilactobacillus sunkii]
MAVEYEVDISVAHLDLKVNSRVTLDDRMMFTTILANIAVVHDNH